MKNGLRHFGLACGVVGLLAAVAEASTPTFSLNMAGIKKAGQDPVKFRDIACDPNADDCETLAGPGSKCVDTEVLLIPGFFRDRCSPLDQVVALRCVGGPTPGIPCSMDNDCGFRGACRRLAVPASHCVGGLAEGALCTGDAECGLGGTCVQGSIVPLLCRDGPTSGEPCREHADCGAGGSCAASFVEPGDQIILEAFLHGWDDDLDVGACNLSPTFPACDDENPCTGRHCQGDLSRCASWSDCIGGQQCVPNECLVAPLAASYQWRIQSDRLYSLTSENPRSAMYPARIECTTDADCRHGRDTGGSTSGCTCGNATCDPDWYGGRFCSRNATAYIDKLRADYLYRELPGGDVVAAVQTIWTWLERDALITYVGAPIRGGLEDPQQDEYVGTLWLQMPVQAAGTYKPGLNPDPNLTLVTNEWAIPFPGINLVDLQIEVFNPCEGPDIIEECDGSPWCSDCNSNGIPDGCDLTEGSSDDCNDNGTPDECEPDCNGNDSPDDCDIIEGVSRDCDLNQLPDECDNDSDQDGVIDACDGCPLDPNKIEPGLCGCGIDDHADSDDDGVPDCNDQCPGIDDATFAPDCVDVIPTISSWGMIVLTLLLLTAAKGRFNRSRSLRT